MTSAACTVPPQLAATVDAIVAEHGEDQRRAAERGVRQVAARWEPRDGTPEAMHAFCVRHFVSAPEARAALVDRLERALELVGGHLHEVRRSLRWWSDVRGQEVKGLPGVDDVLATFDPAPDLADQFYRQRLAFVALLNLPRPELREMLAEGAGWSTDEWAQARIAQAFGARIPEALAAEARRVAHEANMFVSGFHVPVGRLVTAGGERWFPAERALIAHWLVREEIKACYNHPAGLPRQRALAWVMARHVEGTIPAAVMERRGEGAWDPERNTIDGAAPGPLVGAVRYRTWMEHAALSRKFDPLYPEQPTAMARKFDLQREVPEEDVERLMVSLLESPVRAKLAAFLTRRLGRPLEAFDVYFDDVAESRSAAALDAAVRARFPDERAFQAALPTVLRELGFPADEAEFLGRRITVEIARGAGHAVRPGLPEYGAWLRTSRLPGELGWDGFDTAMHELGHNLEQLASTFWVPRPALRNVPNTACTEAFAFLYQSLAKRVLGLEDAGAAQRAADLDAVQTMLAACQIAGPGLLELHAWRWIYAHPGASPEALRDEVVAIADRLWRRFYERDFGPDRWHILGAYQHMVGHPLYLPDYCLGHIMSHQIRSFMRGRDLARETRRICSLGRVTPDLWMRRAVGEGISAEALARDAGDALARLD
ncbi:MAG: hypothetical protein U0574_03555 [Phycisphaerales bacterium]